MEKILFACDLDNTLIHSHKHKKEGELLVETIDGKEQSFMTPKAVELLGKILKYEHLIFLPVTTRSVEQYMRICFPEHCKPKFALTANGMILLQNEKIDSSWKTYSEKMLEPFTEEINRLLEKYSHDDDFRICRTVNGMYLFTACRDGVKVPEKAEICRGETFLDVAFTGQKMYFFPPMANKGKAVERFCQSFGFSKIITAGDSEIDLSMHEISHLAIIPDERLGAKLKNINRAVCQSGDFSEFVLQTVFNIL